MPTGFVLNVIASVTTRLPNNDIASHMAQRFFMLDLDSLLNVETALPLVQHVVDTISFPMHPSILNKIMDSASHVFRNGPFVTYLGLPFVTVCISDDHGVVSTAGEFDQVEEHYYDEDDDDYDDEDEDEESGRALQLKTVKVEEKGKECAICLEKLEIFSEATCLPCYHLYHHACIGSWLQKGKNECPLCRSCVP